jgi:hypothetical protein
MPCATKNHPSTWQLVCHLLTGAGLGSLLALALMSTHSLFVGALAMSPSPVMASIGIVVASASIIGIGSAITGALFSALERTKR